MRLVTKHCTSRSLGRPGPTTSREHILTSYDVVDCPFCASVLCIRVARLGFSDFLRELCGFYPWYCRNCFGRFYAWKRAYTAEASESSS
jgi:hypothetical protein